MGDNLVVKVRCGLGSGNTSQRQWVCREIEFEGSLRQRFCLMYKNHIQGWLEVG